MERKKRIFLGSEKKKKSRKSEETTTTTTSTHTSTHQHISIVSKDNDDGIRHERRLGHTESRNKALRRAQERRADEV